MRLPHVLVLSLFVYPLIVAMASAQTIAPATQPATRPSRPGARAPVPEHLPGKGLAQHDFLYAGEWDTRNPQETLFIVRGGKVVWTYSIPDHMMKDGKRELNEWGDVHMLSNGNVLFSRKTGATEIDQEKNIVWDYDGPAGTEIHTAQPIGLDRVLLCQNGTPAKALLINKRTNQVEMEHVLPSREPVDQRSVHGQFRHIRQTRAGTYLIAHLNMGKVIEYDKDWNPFWQVDAPSAWAAVRLHNGNTLVSGNQHGYVREFNPAGEIVWQIEKDDLPGIPLYTVQETSRLANGNTIICNWAGSIARTEWDKTVQVIEVTPDKQVVWALHQWKDPDLGPSSCIQILTEPGKAEEGDLQR